MIMRKDVYDLIDFSMKYHRDEGKDEISQTDGKKIYDFAIGAVRLKNNFSDINWIISSNKNEADQQSHNYLLKISEFI